MVKQYLGKSNGDIYTICKAIDKKLANSVQNYNDARARSRDRPRHIHKAEPLFSRIVSTVTPNPLTLISHPIQLAKSCDPNSQCSGNFKQTIGLPCCHSLRQHIANNEPINIQDIHPHWRFDTQIGPQPAPPTLPRLLAEEPVIIQSTRGRPSGQRHDNSTRRDPLFFV